MHGTTMGEADSKYGKDFDAETLVGRGRVLEFLLVFVVFGGFPSGSGRVSYPLGPI